MNSTEQYDEDGYVIFRDFFSDMEISRIDSHVDRIYRQWVRENKSEIFDKKLVNMHSLTSPEYFQGLQDERIKFFEVITPEKLTKKVEEIFGQGIYFHNTQLFFNPSNGRRLPYWHRDLQYSPVEESVQSAELNNMLSLHVRIPLAPEKGVELVNGSHKRWDTELERNVRLELNGHSNNESLPNTTLTNLLPGDVLIFNAQMIHRGNYELNPVRKALDLCIGTYHPLTSCFFDARVLPTREEIAGITNNHWYKAARKIVANILNREERVES